MTKAPRAAAGFREANARTWRRAARGVGPDDSAASPVTVADIARYVVGVGVGAGTGTGRPCTRTSHVCRVGALKLPRGAGDPVAWAGGRAGERERRGRKRWGE